jgi:hypothetical protein
VLTSDLADVDATPDDSLQLARRALEHARSEGEPFDPVFNAIVMHLAERPAQTHSERVERAQLLAALSDLRGVWRSAYERRDEPKPPKPSALKTVPLDLREMRRLFRQATPKRCVWCDGWFVPSFNHSLSCSPECAHEQTRARRKAWYMAQRNGTPRRRRRAQVPALA